MPAVFDALSPSRRAANVAIETWSSWFAEVGRLPTEAGWASVLFSLANAAAVTWAIMKPEFRPPFSTRNGGNFERSCRSRARSAVPTNADLGHRQGQVVGGHRHRLGVEIAAGKDGPILGEDDRVVGNGVGLVARTSAAWRICMRQAPITCGWQRSE